ncbi:MAG: signal recognition particle protein [Bdellovibrionaceae bacterium]|nr:signal recognition particle protein [Pseudobdellovibrionaceae bacterium]
MFDNLSDKILGTLKKVRGQGRISEKNIEDAIKEIRLSLLEADVNFKVVKSFIDSVKAKALGADVIDSVSPGQQFTKIVQDELTQVLGGEAVALDFKNSQPGQPSVIFLVGLQGTGKTTTAAKLALYLRQKHGKKPGLLPVDIYRPAAIEQLKTLAKQNNLPVFPSDPSRKPQELLESAKKWAKEEMIEVLLVDTAGRLQIDEELMSELKDLKQIWTPSEILLVADAMLGQQAVNVAEGFNKSLGLSGLILTKVDGDARGGAALSIRQATGVPIKFLGVGEKVGNLEVFHPDRLASRILDMGDVVTLVERAQEVIDEKDAKATAKKMARNEFTVEDFLKQIQMMKKLGGFESIMGMMPGMGQMMKGLKNMAPPEKEIKKIEAIIHSMTLKERHNHKLLNGSRRKRIAMGSGTEVSDVNKFIRQFEESRKMMSKLMKMGMGKGGFPGMGRGFPF